MRPPSGAFEEELLVIKTGDALWGPTTMSQFRGLFVLM
jgi:hypothetical protein